MPPTALLFPGQGSQTDDMRATVKRFRPELLQAAVEAVGEDPFARVEEGTQFAQPAIFCASLADGRLREGANVLLCAFGSGLTWGAGVVRRGTAHA